MNRMIVVPWLLWAVIVGVAIAGVFYASKSMAALNYRAEGANGQVAGLRLSEAPCTEERVLTHLKPQFHSRFKAAVLTWAGRDWHSCWTKFESVGSDGKEQEMVFSVDEEGSVFQPVPFSMFREDSI